MKLSNAFLASSTFGLVYEVTLVSDINAPSVEGKLVFSQLNENDAVTIRGKVFGLKPLRTHAFHFHESSIIGQNCTSAGESWDPLSDTFGAPTFPNRGLIDLPPLEANKGGEATVSETSSLISLFGGQFDIANRSVVVYQFSDAARAIFRASSSPGSGE